MAKSITIYDQFGRKVDFSKNKTPERAPLAVAPVLDSFRDYVTDGLTPERLGDRDLLILHPGPVMRNIDISDVILDDPRCKVLEQVKNGVYTRMAILKLLLLDS